MHVRRTVLQIAALVFLALAFSASARAQANDTYVSSAGLNTNNCLRTAPCRTFAGAQAKTNAGGEITVLDSGEYGYVMITKPLRITAVGVHATISVPANLTGINLNTPQDTDVVVLRGITINGQVNSLYGIRFLAPAKLHVEDCTINRIGNNGISAANLSGQTRIFLKDTVVRDNKNGMFLAGQSGAAVRAMVDNCRFENNSAIGIYVGSTTKVIINNSVIAGARADTSTAAGLHATGNLAEIDVKSSTVTGHGYGMNISSTARASIEDTMVGDNDFEGVYAASGASVRVSGSAVVGNSSSGIKATGTGTIMDVEDTRIAHNGYGLRSESSATIRVSNSVIVKNVYTSLGPILSRRNNTVEDNINGNSPFSGTFTPK